MPAADIPAPVRRRYAMAQVSKRFGAVAAVTGASITVEPGEVHVLLGENGAGKSTLMQMLYGLCRPDSGRILVDDTETPMRHAGDAAGHGIGMVHQEFMLVRSLTVAENILLGLRGSGPGLGIGLDLAAARRRIVELSERHGLAIDPDRLCGSLPVGVQQRVEILKLLYRSASLLILDEPTALLGPVETDLLFALLRMLRAEGRSILLVTHKLREIAELADRVTVMRHGHTVATQPARGISTHALSHLMVGRDVPVRRSPVRPPPGAPRLRVRGLRLTLPVPDPATAGVSFEIRSGEILGIAGVEGNGQTELAESLVGLRGAGLGRSRLDRDAEITLDGIRIEAFPVARRREAGIAYIPGDRGAVGSVAAASLADNAALGSHRRRLRAGGLLMDRQRHDEHARAILRGFDVRAAGPASRAGDLSGGNLQKLIVGREMTQSPRLLIVEHPTRGLDIGAVEALWARFEQERARGTAILLISADLEEILALSDRIAVLYGGEIVATVAGEGATAEGLAPMMAGLPMMAELGAPTDDG